MKKLLALVVLGGVAYGGYWYVKHRTPEKRTCARIVELCGDKGDEAKCEHDLGELAKTASAGAITRLDHCIADAQSCPTAAGCLVGTGMSSLGEAFQQFMKGFSNTVGK